MVWSAIPFCMFLVLLHPPTTHLVGIFTNYIRSLSRKNKWMCEIQNHRVLDFTSHPASTYAPLTLSREPRWRHFDLLWRPMENWGFNQIKKFLWQITPKNKVHHFSEKNFLVFRCTLSTVLVDGRYSQSFNSDIID